MVLTQESDAYWPGATGFLNRTLSVTNVGFQNKRAPKEPLYGLAKTAFRCFTQMRPTLTK